MRPVIMVGVAQLVELRIVIPAVVGSSPIVHPNKIVGASLARDIWIFASKLAPTLIYGPLAQLAEQ